MRRNTAFTLIELLVVITIISLLVAMTIPGMYRAREHARSTRCVANLKQLHQAVVNYGVEHGGTIPYSASEESYDDHDNIWYQSRTGWLDWYDYSSDKVTYWWGNKGTTCITNGTLYGYARDTRIYLCPTFSGQSVCGRSNPKRSYSLNRAVSGGSITMRGANRHILFTDAGLHAYLEGGPRISNWGLRGQNNGNWNSYGTWSDPASVTSGRQYQKQLDGEMIGIQWQTGRPHEHIGAYHNGKGNAIFVDGHIDKISYTDTTNACSGNWGDY